MEIRPSNFTFTYTQDVMDTATEIATHYRYVNALVIYIQWKLLLVIIFKNQIFVRFFFAPSVILSSILNRRIQCLILDSITYI